MLSLTIDGLQGITPKLMALQRGWFRHGRRDFRRFTSLGTKRIRTWPYLTSPWVIGSPNTLLCFISFLISTFWETFHSTLFHCCSNGPGLWTWTPQSLGLGSLQRGLFYSRGLCPRPRKTCPLHNIESNLTICTHTRW